MLDWEKTSLRPYVEMLEKHAQTIMGDVRRVKREQGKFDFAFIARGDV